MVTVNRNNSCFTIAFSIQEVKRDPPRPTLWREIALLTTGNQSNCKMFILDGEASFIVQGLRCWSCLRAAKGASNFAFLGYDDRCYHDRESGLSVSNRVRNHSADPPVIFWWHQEVWLMAHIRNVPRLDVTNICQTALLKSRLLSTTLLAGG